MNAKQLAHLFIVSIATAFIVMCGPVTAHAHTGAGPVHDLLHGLEHPLTGLDHVCAMVAVGIWAAQRGGRSIAIMPVTFVIAIAVGAVLGMAGVSLPYVEPSIALSVVVLGALVATAARLPISASLAIACFFAIVHGYAHGAETPADVSGLLYAAGFLASTACLLAAGVGFGRLMQRLDTSQVARAAGAAIVLCGILLSMR